jgi:HSP20 family protein
MKISDLIPWVGTKYGTPARRSGADPLRALQADIDHAFGDFWRRFDLPMLGGADPRQLDPRVDVRDTGKAVEVIAELPGMSEADVEIAVADGVLNIRGEKKAERETEKKGYVVRERSYGTTERVVLLPEGLDLDSAKATFKNGVLTVTIAKTAAAQAAVKHISVQAA